MWTQHALGAAGHDGEHPLGQCLLPRARCQLSREVVDEAISLRLAYHGADAVQINATGPQTLQAACVARPGSRDSYHLGARQGASVSPSQRASPRQAFTVALLRWWRARPDSSVGPDVPPPLPARAGRSGVDLRRTLARQLPSGAPGVLGQLGRAGRSGEWGACFVVRWNHPALCPRPPAPTTRALGQAAKPSCSGGREACPLRRQAGSRS